MGRHKMHNHQIQANGLTAQLTNSGVRWVGRWKCMVRLHAEQYVTEDRAGSSNVGRSVGWSHFGHTLRGKRRNDLEQRESEHGV